MAQLIRPLISFWVTTVALSVLFTSCKQTDAVPNNKGNGFQPKAGQVINYTFRNPETGNLEREIKDSIVALFPNQPDSVVHIRITNKTIDPVTGVFGPVQNFPSVADQILFAKQILSDTGLGSGPDPINFHTLNQTLQVLDLSIGDLYLILSSGGPTDKYDFIIEASKRLRSAYPFNAGYGSDFEFLLTAGKLTANSFFSTLTDAGLTKTQLLDKMASQQISFGELYANWKASGDTSITGLKNYLSSGLLNNRRTANNIQLDHSDITWLYFGQPRATTVQSTGLENLIINTDFPSVNYEFFTFKYQAGFKLETKAGYNAGGLNNLHIRVYDAYNTAPFFYNWLMNGSLQLINIEHRFRDPNGNEVCKLYFRVRTFYIGVENASTTTHTIVYATRN